MKTPSAPRPGQGADLTPAIKRSRESAPILPQKSIGPKRNRAIEILDRVEMIRDQKETGLKKGMRGTILDVLKKFKGEPQFYMLEVIKPPIVSSVSESDIILADE